jgi:hypothetical protein
MNSCSSMRLYRCIMGVREGAKQGVVVVAVVIEVGRVSIVL